MISGGRGGGVTADRISFLTPYWNGREMMLIHLQSIRRFYPSAPILISKRGGDREEMESHRAVFDVQYWLEECDYIDAILRLLERCDTEYACIADHDVVLLSSLDDLLAGLVDGRWDLVGMEERIRESPDTDSTRFSPPVHGWLRFAPGQMDTNLLMFNWRQFKRRWGLAGVKGKRPFGAWHYEDDYGICQKLQRHKYLLPFHTGRYGMGNLLKDGDTPIAWHQWYGSYRRRLRDAASDPAAFGGSALAAHARKGETAFLSDYPNLDLSTLTPAWGPGWDIHAEQLAAERAYPGPVARSVARVRRWRRDGVRGLAVRVLVKLDRWRRRLRSSAGRQVTATGDGDR